MELEERCLGTGVGAPEHITAGEALWRLLLDKDLLIHLGIMVNKAQPLPHGAYVYQGRPALNKLSVQWGNRGGQGAHGANLRCPSRMGQSDTGALGTHYLPQRLARRRPW